MSKNIVGWEVTINENDVEMATLPAACVLSEMKELEELKSEILKVWNEDGDNGEIQMKTPIAWQRVLRLAEK